MRNLILSLTVATSLALAPAAFAQDAAVVSHAGPSQFSQSQAAPALDANLSHFTAVKAGDQVTPECNCGGPGSNSFISLAVSPFEVFRGTPVTFKADVQSSVGGPAPTGTVTFFVAGYNVGTAPLYQTTASINFGTRNIGEGTFNVTAVYNGSATYNKSTSPVEQFYVMCGCSTNSTSDMSASPSSFKPGQILTLATDVSPNQGGPDPTGTVLFYAGPNHEYYLGSAPIVQGVATLYVNTKGVPPGTYQVESEYTGNSIYLPSTSETDYVNVQ
jgi:hypothetical protein